MRIYPLFSSSKGNSTYVGTKSEGLLIDCGVSCTRLMKALAAIEIPVEAIKGILITHEHADHIQGLKIFTRKTGIPVYSRSATLDRLSDMGYISSETYDIGDEPVRIGSFTVCSSRTFHDAVSPCCYRISMGDSSCAVCTDLGTVTADIEDALCGVDAILLEANYDSDMLSHGPYPIELKKRISSFDGHLENSQTAGFAVRLVSSGTKRIILGHLSENNNDPHTALEEVTDTLLKNGFSAGGDYMIMAAAPEDTRYFSF